MAFQWATSSAFGFILLSFFLYYWFFFYFLVAKTVMSCWLQQPWCKLHPTCFPPLCHFSWLLRNEHCNVSTNSSTVLQQTWARSFKTRHCVSQKSLLLKGSCQWGPGFVDILISRGRRWFRQMCSKLMADAPVTGAWLSHSSGIPKVDLFFFTNSLWRCLYISAIFINLDILPTILPVQPDEIVQSWRGSSRNSISFLGRLCWKGIF